MRIIKSKYTGFCAGVQRAVDALYRARSAQGFDVLVSSILVHNSQVASELGAEAFSRDTKYKDPYFILISSHGCDKSLRDLLDEGSTPYADATCPIVADNLDKALSCKGDIIYIADEHHSEARFFLSYIDSARVDVVASADEAMAKKEALKALKNPIVITQTTFSTGEYTKIVAFLKTALPDAEFYKSICPDCLNRRKEAIRLASSCDCVIVVGDDISSNARELVEISKSINKNTFLVLNSFDKTLDEVKKGKFSTAGIISSASSAEHTFQEISSALEQM